MFAAACVDIKEDTGTNTTDTSTTEDTEEAWSPDLAVDWAADAVTLNFSNPAEGGMYYWGIVENAGACLDSGSCWTGEDCFMGYDLQDNGGNLLFCHPVGTTGVTLAYGATGANTVEGETTTFNLANGDYSVVTTYILDDRASADAPCWTWGVDESYYSGYEKACTSM